ncbi:hypothetical protein OG866_02500 [Streptomyces sp. NBC_00663]|uniref:hypothetical protein n=1 Tax=Streptomyces sp. NBC_00663 TaxID=2975801 RepID=UPI002E304AD2|nr:hypothetical protein [Streptomyces sp. NBC_00663]
MATTRARPIALAIILGLVAVLGIVWLVRSATTDGENAADKGTVSSASASNGNGNGNGNGNDPDPDGGIRGTDPGTGSGTDRQDDGSSSSTSASQGTSATGSSTPGGETHKSGRRSIHVSGVRLNGNGDRDGCATIINKTSRPLTVKSVSFAVSKGPAKPAVSSDNAAHCSGDNPTCLGATVQEGDQCDAGAVLPPGVPNGTYKITTTVDFTCVCVDPENDPCDKVTDWGGPPPTPQYPLTISGPAAAPGVSITVGEEPEEEDTPAPDTPEDVPDSPDSVAPEDEQPQPDAADVPNAIAQEQG